MKHKLRNFFRQFGLMLLVIWTVVSLVTLLIELVPGDPATTILGETATPEQIANFNEKHGLDRPAFFFSYAGDSGFSFDWLPNQRPIEPDPFDPYLSISYTDSSNPKFASLVLPVCCTRTITPLN